jgi:very-short-patch-repair endonuclease
MNSSEKPRTPLDRALARLAARQHGVVHVGQLYALGMSRSDVSYRVGIGRLHRLHRGVYAVGHLSLTDESTFIAAVFAFGDDAVLSHLPAAAVYGFLPWRGGDVEVTVPRRVARRDGIRPRFAREVERVSRRGIPITTPARTLLDISRTWPRDVARRAVNQALVDRKVTIPMLYREAQGPLGARLRRLLAKASPTRSELEDVAVEFLRRHDIAFESNFRLAGWEVDFWLPEHNLVIETDGGRFHDNPLQRADDERKQRALEGAGHRVRRLRWHDLLCASPTSLAA